MTERDDLADRFEEIAPIVGRSAAATRQLASRARRRVRGAETRPKSELVRQRKVVDAFLAALRGGDFEGLLAVLDPDLVVRADMGGPAGPTPEIRGAAVYAKQATAFAHLARLARPALVNGSVGVVMAPRGRLMRVVRLTIEHGKITRIEIIGNPARLAELDVSIVDSI